jgi:hypothetical protein
MNCACIAAGLRLCLLMCATADDASSDVVHTCRNSTSASACQAPTTTAAPSTTTPSPAPCTNDCGSCCFPGCHASNGTCYACAAGSYSSNCSNHAQSSCSVCPSEFFCPGGASQPSECPSGMQAGQGVADASQCAAIATLQPGSLIAIYTLLCAFWWLTWFTPAFSGKSVSALQIQSCGY